ncbi:MAG: hypothetical protein JWO67_4248 [Streptosporangiaceae bacterium]|nr:hypothetical protein [Streptosporangiaceae bacterium]
MQTGTNVGSAAAGVDSSPPEPIRPSVDAMAAAESAQRRAKKDAPLRLGFLIRDKVGQPDPPMARILRGGRGGRGGDVRLRLFLSLLWMVRDVPELSFPARAWAELLGLDQPDTNGARRIKDALRWLDVNQFIRLERVPGRDSVVHLLDDIGLGRSYELPGAAYNRLREDPEAARMHTYLKVPGALWTRGWMSILPGPAVAMLIVLLYESSRTDKTWVWFSPSVADLRYGISEDTRVKGIRKLQQAGLIDIGRQPVGTDTFDYKRFRNVYQLRTDVLLTGEVKLDLTITRPGPMIPEGELFSDGKPTPRGFMPGVTTRGQRVAARRD